MPFAIAKLYEHHDTIPVALIGPDGQRVGLPTLHLASPYSAVAKSALAGIAADKDAPLEQTLHAAYAALVTGWEGVLDEQGQPVAFSVALCTQLFDACPWIYEQVVAAFGDRARFFTRGASGSAPTPASTAS